MIPKTFYLLALSFLLTPQFPAHAETRLRNSSEIVFQAMQDEMARALRDLKIDVFNPPYFINYQIRNQDYLEVVASFGSILNSKSDSRRVLYVDVKIGDPQFDSSTPDSHQYSVEQFVPLEDDLDALKRAIWYETDLRYKQAIMNYLKKKGRFVSGVEKHELPDFSKGQAEPATRIDAVPELDADTAQWEDLARRVSAEFKNASDIEKSSVKIFGRRLARHYLDSDGNKIRDASLQFGVILEAWSKTASGSPIHDQETVYFSRPEHFPAERDLVRRAKQLIAGVQSLKKAPEAQPYVGPALFSPDATAVLFHEAIGHRLEADRLRNASDGKTFMEKIGEPILPPFITVVDNPAMDRYDGADLLGHYQFDDEGQPSQEVVLIDRGMLRSFLLSRAPVLGFSRTNGHARGDGMKSPMSRMSNFVVRSDNRISAELLKQRLIEEIKRQNKPYGLLIRKISGGETHTESADYQVFKGKPLYMYKVYPEDGREELVRGVEFVGTPLSMIGKIMATGDDYTVINGFCGAESGVLPVTSIAPTALLREVELQVSREQSLRKPILAPPAITE
ncbi:MAG: TldD/PmbA family protein [Nitrospinae bacterium]|nr:TldD/PmbA family protein [Nitrospinota bacterium]